MAQQTGMRTAAGCGIHDCVEGGIRETRAGQRALPREPRTHPRILIHTGNSKHRLARAQWAARVEAMIPASRAYRCNPSYAWSHRLAHVRVLLLALVALPLGAAADEALPFAELSYRHDANLVLPEPIASWWQESASEAMAWWSEATGVSVAAGQAIANLHSLRLVAGGIPAPDGLLSPTVAGWLRETVPVLTPSVLAAGAAWPGFITAVGQGGASLRSAHGIVPADADPPAGLRVMLHGPGLYEELRRRTTKHERGAGPSADDLEEVIVRLARQWEPSASVATGADGAIGTFASGLPARWFRPVDAAVVSRLPADTVAWLALAIDGRALGEDLQAALAEQGLATVWPFALIPFLTPQTVAQACDGTWVVAGGPSGLLIRAPRSTALDALLGGMAVLSRLKLPTDQTPVALGDGLLGACSARDWIVAETAPGIAAWFNDTPHLPVQLQADALLAGWLDRRQTSAAVDQLAGILPEEEALPSRTWQGTEHGEESAWGRMTKQLDGPGSHCLTGTGGDGTLTLALAGPVLPWLLPGMAIRWFADIAQDEEGKRRLRAEVDRLHRDKLAVFPAEGLAGIPAIDPARLAAWKGLIASIHDITEPASKLQSTESRRLGDEVLPWTIAEKDAAILEYARQAVAATLPLDDPAFPRGGDPLVLTADATDWRDQSRFFEVNAIARGLAFLGLHLVAHGDAHGALLADRAMALLGAPQNLNGLWQRIDYARDRDWFIAGSLADHDRRAYARWLDEPPPTISVPSAWHGERVYFVGRIAEVLLGTGSPATAALVDERPWLPLTWLRFGLGQPHTWRAWTAPEMASIMDVMARIEQGDLATIGKDAFRLHSPLLGGFTVSLDMILDTGRLAQCRHRLIRLAARLRDLAAAGKLPPTQAAANAAVGRLELTMGGTSLPLTYQRLADNAFRLFIADQVPPPPGYYAADRWKGLVAAIDVSAGRHLVLPGKVLEVVVDPRLPPPPKTGTNDF